MSLLHNTPVVWSIACGLGIVCGIGIYWFIFRGNPGEMANHGPLSVDDRKLLEQVNSIIDRRLTDKTTGVKDVASELNTSASSIERLFKRNYGESFQICLNRSRIEVAKERLRSSNSSEATIAEQCGFKHTSEMARFFWRFYRTTPLRFRMEQQVT